MKRKNIILAILILLANLSVFGQDVNKVELLSSKDNSTTISFTLTDYQFEIVTTQQGNAYTISAENTVSMLEKDAPDLPKFTTSIIIPDGDEMKITVVSSKYTDYDEEIIIAPSKGNLTRDIDPNSISYEFGEIYQKNEFFPKNIASLNTPFIIRDFRGQTVVVNPFQYNPVSKKLRIYSEIIVKIESAGIQGENVFTRTKSSNKINYEFDNIYSNLFLNYSKDSKYTSLSEDGNMLIICNDDWVDEMQEFVTWKNQRGIKTEIVPKSVAGTTAAAIKTFVTNYYNNQAKDLTFLLLVGDAAQIPTFTVTGGGSDNTYAYITGNDHYLEFFVGRFSAENAAQVLTQVQRTIEYEKGTDLQNGWLNKTIGIGSNDTGVGDDNEYDWQHIRNLQTKLIGFTYVTPTIEIFDGSQGGNDVSGNATITQVATAVNNGAGTISYCGHGADTYWVTSNFGVSNADALTNDNKLPFIFDVACVNGNFTSQTCFAEAWMRSVNGTEPAGAIAIIASTINQSWSPPMAAQDEMNEILVETFQNNIKRTFGGITINGCFKMNEQYSDFEMTDTWTIFGDPSLQVRTDDPSILTATHQNTIIIGTSNFIVNCAEENATACLSKDGIIIGVAKVTGGMANISVVGVNPGDVLDLVVTGFNKKAYITTILVAAANAPYVILNNHSLNILPNFDKDVLLSVILENVAASGSGYDATNLSATLTCTDEYISIIDGTETLSNILAGSTLNVDNSFSFSIANNVPDQHIASFHLTITSSSISEQWSSDFNVTLNAPVLEASLNGISDNSGELTFTSSPQTTVNIGDNYSYDIAVVEMGGNDNGLLDAGETANVVLNSQNSGHADLIDATCELSSTSQYITVNTSLVNISLIEVGQTLPNNFNISVSENTPIGTTVDLTFTFIYAGYNEQVTLNLPVGLQIEDFESGNFTTYPWQLTGSPSWTITNTGAYDGTYCAKSGSGLSITSTLKINANVTASGNIKFWSKVSSELDWDFLKFYVDATEKGSWSGNVGWAEHTYPITAGQHTFRWEYTADNYLSTGSDCAWIDFITFPGISTSKLVDNKGITITSPTLPSWLSLVDNGNGTASISGTTPNSAGIQNINLIASDGITSVNQEFNLELVAPNQINDLDKNINIYPNPSNGKFIIEAQLQNVTFDIIDVTGRNIYSGIITNNKTSVDVSNFSKGTYFIRFNETAQTNKIFIIN